MKSLFVKSDNDSIIARINQLSPDSTAKWGKMTVSQMLAHCQRPLHIAFGEVKTKRRTIVGYLFGGWAKKQFLAGKTLQKNLPTDPNFIVAFDANFEEEKNKLHNYLRRFSEQGKSAIIDQPHPFFGKLTPEEWDVLTQAHLDHHLKQFGV